jgi:hypothetical protein
MMIPYCSGLMPSCWQHGQQQRREDHDRHEALEHRAHEDRDHDHRGQEQRRAEPATALAIAVVTPSSVIAHEKIVAALTVKKIMPFRALRS